jgi:hypothetical protein
MSSHRDRQNQGRLDIAEYVRERPMTALGLAAAAGFILNGGANTRIGRAVTGFIVPILLRSVVTGMIVERLTASGDPAKD